MTDTSPILPPAIPPLPGLPPLPAGYQLVALQRTNVLSIISLVAAFVFPLAAIVTGHLALGQIRRTGEGGHGLAKAGLILGYVFTSLSVALFVLWAVFFFLMVANHGFTNGCANDCALRNPGP